MIYLDSGVITRLIAGPPALRATYRSMIGSRRVTTSQVAYIECVCKPIELRMPELVEAFDAYFTSSDLHVVDLDAQVARQAAAVRASSNLKIPDAIHYATAVQERCDELWTTDTDFERCVSPGKLAIRILAAA